MTQTAKTQAHKPVLFIGFKNQALPAPNTTASWSVSRAQAMNVPSSTPIPPAHFWPWTADEMQKTTQFPTALTYFGSTAWFCKRLHNPCAGTGRVVCWWHHGWDKGEEEGRTTSFSSSVDACCLQLTSVTTASLYLLKAADLPRPWLACKAVPYILAQHKMPTANTVIMAWSCYIFTQKI